MDISWATILVLTATAVFGIMKKLHKSLIADIHFEPKEGQRTLLCSNKSVNRCPSFGIYPDPNQMEETVALKYLAGIIADAFLESIYESE